MHRTRWAWLVAAVPSALCAQLPKDARWELEGNRGSYCIWYLADPAIAQHMAPSRATLTTAAEVTALPQSVTRVIQDEPRFAQWIPGVICLGFYDRISSETHTVAEGRLGRPVTIVTSALAIHSPLAVAGADYLLLEFLTNDRAVARAAEAVGFTMEGLEMVNRVHSDEADPYLSFHLGGADLVWVGHAAVDSSVGTTRSMSFGYAGARTVTWQVTTQRAGGTARLMIGALRISGKTDLAKALKGSPIRAIGPEERGGTAALLFQAVGKR